MTLGIDQLLGLAGFVLAAIRNLVDNRGTRAAEEILAAIASVYGAVDDATTGKVTPEQAAEAIQSLMARLRGNDAAADEALRKKFAPEDGT